MPEDDQQRAEAQRRIKEEELRAGIRKRPLLASIIAIILMLFGFLVVLGAILFLMGVGLVSSMIPGEIGGITAGITIGSGIILLLIGVVFFMTGIGLWKLRKWALYLVALPVVLYILLVIVGTVLTGNAVGFFLGMGMCASPVFIIALIFTIYFISIRKHFD